MNLKHLAVGLLAAASLTVIGVAPASADTLKEIIAKGTIVTIEGIGDIDITYKPDGTWSGKNEALEGAIGGPITGKWRIDGEKLCTSAMDQPESCSVYPKDKKSGDTFDVSNETGSATIKIK